MIIKFCDICGNEIKSSELGKIANGALMTIAKADSVCATCAAAAGTLDWCETVREIWRETAKEGETMPDKVFRRWGERDAPCRDCPDRTIGCHGQDANGLYKCERYGEFVTQNEAEKQLRRKECDVVDMLADCKRKKPR